MSLRVRLKGGLPAFRPLDHQDHLISHRDASLNIGFNQAPPRFLLFKRP